MNPSTPPPPRTPPPSPPPGGPKGPTPTGPPRRVADDLMALADALYESPARRDPGSRPQASFAVATPGGPVFPLPAPVGPPRFATGEHRLVGRVEMGDGPPRPGHPGPPPRPQPSPTPHPPPPVIPQI